MHELEWNTVLGWHVWAGRKQERTCIQWDRIRRGHLWGGITDLQIVT